MLSMKSKGEKNSGGTCRGYCAAAAFQFLRLKDEKKRPTYVYAVWSPYRQQRLGLALILGEGAQNAVREQTILVPVVPTLHRTGLSPACVARLAKYIATWTADPDRRAGAAWLVGAGREGRADAGGAVSRRLRPSVVGCLPEIQDTDAALCLGVEATAAGTPLQVVGGADGRGAYSLIPVVVRMMEV